MIASTSLILAGLIALALPRTALSSETPVHITGKAIAWEAPCLASDTGFRCEPPSKLHASAAIELQAELPTLPGEARHAATTLFSLQDFPEIRLSVFLAWPQGNAATTQSIAQWKITLGDEVTCAASSYLAWPEHPALICSQRIGDRLLGVTITDLRIIP